MYVNNIDFLDDKAIGLVKKYADSVRKLHDNNIIRSKNVTGDLGEYYVREFLNNLKGLPKFKLKEKSNKGYDLEDINETGKYRISVKTVTQSTTSCIRESEKKIRFFDYLIIVRLNKEYLPDEMYMCSYDIMKELLIDHSTMKAKDIVLTKGRLEKLLKIYPETDVKAILDEMKR